MPCKVGDVEGCVGCPLRQLDFTYTNKEGKQIHWVGRDRTFVAPKLGPSTRLQIGEAPGEDEDASGEPFTGGAGSWLNRMNANAGIRRADVNIINTIQCRPPENAFPTSSEARFYISKEDGEKVVQHCLKAHVKPFLASRDWTRLDLLGGTALKYLGGKEEGIDKWRGSPVAVPVLGTEIQAIPTFHPAFVMRSQIFSRVVTEDLRKSLIVPPEHYNLYPSIEDVRAFTATEFAFDIETEGYTDQVKLVGLCAEPFKAMVVPFQGEYIPELRRIFRNATRLVGHNCCQFDIPILFKALDMEWAQ